jgi:hypothetical protein
MKFSKIAKEGARVIGVGIVSFSLYIIYIIYMAFSQTI